jgi:hypothetical protein
MGITQCELIREESRHGNEICRGREHASCRHVFELARFNFLASAEALLQSTSLYGAGRDCLSQGELVPKQSTLIRSTKYKSSWLNSVQQATFLFSACFLVCTWLLSFAVPRPWNLWNEVSSTLLRVQCLINHFVLDIFQMVSYVLGPLITLPLFPASSLFSLHHSYRNKNKTEINRVT